MGAALTRFRAIAYLVGVVLILLVGVGMPLKYGWDRPVLVETVGPAHGFLFVGYLAATVDLARRVGWPVRRMLLVMVSGTVPFASFLAERAVTRWVRAAAPATPAGPGHDAARRAGRGTRSGP